METALHLRHLDQEEDWPGISGSLMMFQRIYIGDEFCSNRLPSLTEMKHFSQFAQERNLGITLLTPVLTDDGIEKCSPLFDYLKKRHSEAEVVVNDLGVLFYLKREYPQFYLSAGRLFNKGVKDPRLPDSREAKELLSDSTFDQPCFQEKMAELSVTRLERDIMPYSNGIGKTPDFGLKTSVYFPFGYVTTGRICWTASFRQPSEQRFVPPGVCSMPCNTMTLKLEDRRFYLPVIQNGNTLFYVYTRAMLSSLMEEAEHKDLRLVWQGAAFETGGMV